MTGLEQEIEQVRIAPALVWKPRELAKFRVDVAPSKWGWRQRVVNLCWAIIGKLGGRLEEHTPVWKQVTFSVDSMIGKIRLSRQDLARIWYRQCDTILISPDLLYEVEDESRRSGVFAFDFKYGMAMNEETKVLGMRVVVCPWITGWALLPEEVKK